MSQILPGQNLADVLARILRVDHAGEVGAAFIYKGQNTVLPDGDAYHAKVAEMGQQEETHLKAFELLLRTYQVRPSALLPLWQVAGFSLGAASALLGKKAAMACTISVEEVIEEHYADQIATLKAFEGTEALAAQLEQFLKDEQSHKEEAKIYKGEEIPFYPLLKGCVQFGCKLAIRIAAYI